MGALRRIDPEDGRTALAAWLEDPDTDRRTVATAVRYTLEELAARHPGGSVEVRVPPHGVVQAVPGTQHHRGTPPAVVETDADTWLRLATGSLSTAEATVGGTLRASGERSDLSGYLPLFDPDPEDA
jgi:hypothetical protein